MASKIIVDQLQTTSLALNALTLPASNATANQYLQDNGSGVLSWATINTPAFTSYAVIVDEKVSGTAGGTCTSGSWQTRDLQTMVDPDTIVTSLIANEFKLVAGNYLITWSCPAYAVDRNQSRLHDVTSTIYYHGTSIMGPGPTVTYRADTNLSIGTARVTPSVTTAYRIEHQSGDTLATNGFGYPTGFTSTIEVYTQVQILKEA